MFDIRVYNVVPLFFCSSHLPNGVLLRLILKYVCIPQACTECHTKGSSQYARSQPEIQHLAHIAPKRIITFKTSVLTYLKRYGCMSRLFACWLTFVWHLFLYEALLHAVSGFVQQSPEAGSLIPILLGKILRVVVASRAVGRVKIAQWWTWHWTQVFSLQIHTFPATYLYDSVSVFLCVKAMWSLKIFYNHIQFLTVSNCIIEGNIYDPCGIPSQPKQLRLPRKCGFTVFPLKCPVSLWLTNGKVLYSVLFLCLTLGLTLLSWEGKKKIFLRQTVIKKWERKKCQH